MEKFGLVWAYFSITFAFFLLAGEGPWALGTLTLHQSFVGSSGAVVSCNSAFGEEIFISQSPSFHLIQFLSILFVVSSLLYSV